MPEAKAVVDLPGLRRLSAKELGELHREGHCPAPCQLNGVMDGEVLATAVPAALQPWRGKVAAPGPGGETTGLNRLGLGPLELRRLRFTARTGNSLFGDRQVLLLDHTDQRNPRWVRRFHDELVQVTPQLYLATTHYEFAGRLRHLGYFTLQTQPGLSGQCHGADLPNR